MATKIVTKNSSTASAVPTASDLVQGELAVNVADKRLFTEDNTGTIVELGTNPSTIDINAGSIDGTAIGASSASTGAFTTLTATGLTVDTNTLYVDSTNNRVGIGTTSPAESIHTAGNIRLGDSAPAELYSNSSELRFGVDKNNDNGTSNITFYVDNSEKVRIDSSGNVGIGTSSFNATYDPRLQVTSAASDGTGGVLIQNYLPTLTLEDISGGAAVSQIQQDQTNMVFKNNGAERMRIDSSGNVGIGTSSPSRKVHIDGGSTDAAIQFTNTNTGSTGNDGTYIGHAGTGTDFQLFNYETGYMRFGTAGSEAMRIDSSGNLLVGKTATAIGTAGHTFGNDGYVYHTRAGDIMFLNRTGSDGTHMLFYKDGAGIGAIGTRASQLSIGSADTGLEFNNANDAVIPFNSSTNSGRDNAIDLGISSVRFDDIYATNGTIQTSDRNEKQDIAELSEAEQRVAVAAKGLLRKFRWKYSVAEKGDDARIHFGIIAQDLQAAFEAEGLDAGDYAMFISTTWTDEETNEEKTRMGVRYSELLAFIISAI